jgi:hypothetical protein
VQKETAAHKAGRSGNLSVLEVLRMAGADMDALNAEVFSGRYFVIIM